MCLHLRDPGARGLRVSDRRAVRAAGGDVNDMKGGNRGHIKNDGHIYTASAFAGRVLAANRKKHQTENINGASPSLIYFRG